MPRSRGIVSRAVSALLFFGAAAAVLIFPEGEAGVSRALGFAPAQVPFDLLQIPGAPTADEYDPADPRFDTAELCLDLGGELRNAGGEQVCSGVDANDTFCIPGSDNAFPCRGLYKHVILCNAGYNRPALNPFFCGKVCVSGKKARGLNCETVVNPDDVAAESARSANYFVAEGFSGVAHTIFVGQNYTLSLPENAQYDGFTLNAADSSDNWEIEIIPPIAQSPIAASVLGKISCTGCYPDFITIAVNFSPVSAPVQGTLRAEIRQPLEEGKLTLRLPVNFEDGARARIVSVEPGVDDLFTLSYVSVLARNPDNRPGRGAYTILIETAHNGFLGLLTLKAEANITAKFLPESEWGLTPESRFVAVTVAAGYPQPFHLAFSRNSLAVIVPPSPVPPGLRLEEDGGTVRFYADLNSGYLSAAAALTVRHPNDRHPNDEYEPLVQVVAVNARVIAPPARRTFQASKDNPILGVVLAWPSFAGGRFLDLEDADAFDISEDGAVSGTPSSTGLYTLAADWTTADMLGTLTVHFDMNVGPGRTVIPAEAAPVRAVEIAAVSGFVGAGWTITVSPGYRLEFRDGENTYNGHALNAISGGRNWEMALTTALTARRIVSATARIVCDPGGGCVPDQALSVTAVFNPVLSPPQRTLYAVYDSDAGAAHAPDLPARYEAGGQLTVAGVAGPGGAFVADDAGALIGSALNAPRAGLHVVSLHMTHPGFLGTLGLAVTADVARRALTEPDSGLLFGGAVSVIAAEGYGLEIYRAESRNSEGRIVAPSEIPAGLTLWRRGEAVLLALDHSNPALDGDSFRATALLTVRHAADESGGESNYQDLPQPVTIVADIIHPPAQNGPFEADVSVALRDVAFAPPVHPGISNGLFEDADGDDEFTVRRRGRVTGTPAVAGERTIRGRWAATGMLGALTVTLPLSVQTRRVINPDDVIAERTPSLKAARGFSFSNTPGSRYVTVSVAARDYKLQNPSSPEFDKPSEEWRFAIDASTPGTSDPYGKPAATVWLFIPDDHPIGDPGGANEFGVVMTMIFDVKCPDSDCAPNQQISMTITMEPIFPPAQNLLAAVYNQSPPLSQTLVFPSGYQSSEGRFLSVLGVNGGADSLFTVSQSVGIVSGNNPPAGAYTVTAGFLHNDFYGRLTMKITAVVSPAVPPEADGISAAGRLPGEITTAFGYAGAVHRVTLEDGNNLQFGDPPSPPPGVALSRSADRATVEFVLPGALASGGALAATTALRAVSADPNYRALSQDVELTIRALAAQDPAPRVFSGTVAYENNALLDLKATGAPYDGAVFFKESGDAELTVSANGVVGTSGEISAAGVYNIVVGATSDGFLGVARFNIALDLIEPRRAPGTTGIDAGARKKTRAVASDYVGPVAVFAASAAGATLRAPSAPAGFGFDAGDYVSPQALTVTLTVPPSSGAATVGRFPATILAAGYEPTEISLEVAVRALAPPLPAIEIKAPPFSGEAFNFSSQYYAGGVYRNATFQASPPAVLGPLGVDANGRVTTAKPLETGVYGVTVLAESDADYAGTVALSLTLTVGWRVGFQSFGDGVLTARDAAGNVLVSGALLAPETTARFTAVPAAMHYVDWNGANCPVRPNRTGPSNPSICAIARSKDLNLQVRFVRRVFPVRRGLEYQVSVGQCASLPAIGGAAWRLPNLPEAAGLLFDWEVVTAAAAAGALLPGTPESGGTIQLAPAGSGDAPRINSRFALLASYYGVRDGAAALAEVLREGGRIRVDAASGGVNARYCVRPAAASYVRPPNPAAVCLSPDCATFAATIAAEAGARTTLTLFAWRLDSSGATVVADANFGLDLAFRGGRPMAVETVGDFAGGARTVAVIPSVKLQPGEYGLFDAIPQSGESVSLIFAAPSPLALREISEAERIPASQRLATVWVASDYSGIVHQAAPALGGAGNVVIAPESVPSASPGSALFARAQNQALELNLRGALSAQGDSLRATIRVTLTGAREGVYIPRAEEVVVQLHSLPPPLLAEARFDSSDSRIGGGAALYDFTAGNAEYAGLLFERISGPRKIEVLPDGRVRVRLGETLDSGRAYDVVRAGVRSSSARQYRGDAEFDLRVIVDFSDAEMAAHLPERTARASAAEGHSGAVYTLTLAAGGPSLTLRYLSASPGLEFDSDTGEIALSSPISADYAGNLVVQVGRLLNPASYNATVSVLINAVRAPPQLPLVATIGAGGDVSGAPHQVRLPQGFAAEGFAVDILEVAGGTTDNFAYANDGLALGAAAPAAGSYSVALGLRHDGFMGTLRAEVPAWVGRYDDIPDELEIPSGRRSVSEEVSPLFAGEVGQVAASAEVELLAPPAPENFAWITSGEKSRLALHLTSPLGSAGQIAATATIVQLLNDILEEAEVVVSLTALTAPPERRVSVVDSSASAGLAAATLNLGGKEGISFEEIADDANAFAVNDEGTKKGEVALTRHLSAGTYGYTVGIWWILDSFDFDKFLGTVFYPLRVDVLGALPPADALPPGDGSEILAAAGYSGTLTVFVPSHPEVSLRFPELARTAFDARTDYGYDYAANALTRKSPLGLGEEDVVAVTLEASRLGYVSRDVELTVSIRALGDLGAPAPAPAPPGAFGVVYDLAVGALEGAAFERDDSSSPKLSLLPSGEVSVSPLSPLGGPGASYTLFASAVGQFLGRAELSLAVRVEGRLRRGLFYQELADSESSCAALGAGWRPPNLAEAAGLLFDGETAEINSRSGEFLPGFPSGGSVNVPLSGFAEADRHRLILPSESPGLGTSFPSRLAAEFTARTTRLRDSGGQANARVVLDDESPFRHCVYPGARDYAPPSDPAVVCYANADASGCAPLSGVSDVAARTAGAAATVTIAAGRGVEFLSRVAEDGFYVSLLAAEPSDLFAASEAGVENGLLAVRVELSRGLEVGEEALGTLRLAPKVGATTELIVRFSGPAGVRRGLLFSPVSSGRLCSALGAGWRSPNWAEAAGLIAAGSVATVFASTNSGAVLPGVSAEGAEVSLFASAAGDSDPLGVTLRSGLLARTDAGISAVLAAPDGTGAALSQISEGGEFYCVFPILDSYEQPQDPAGVCLAPNCGRTALTDGEAGARTLATLFAWRFGPSGQTATVSSSGFGLDVSHVGGAQADVENVGAFVGGARTVALTAREKIDAGAFAEFSAVPQVGATLRFRLAPYVLFAGRPLVLSVAAIIDLRANDFGDLLSPLSVTARYFGARRGLHYVRTPGVVVNSNAYSICEAGGAGWRIPRIGELAGLLSDSDADFGTLTDSGLQRDAHDRLSSLAGARRELSGRPGTRVDIPPKIAGDSPLAAARVVEKAHYADVIHSKDGAPQAFHIVTEEVGRVQISLAYRGAGTSLDGFRVICVAPTDEAAYQPPPQLAEARLVPPRSFDSSVFDRLVSGDGVFHRITARAFRYARGAGPGRAAREEDVSVSLSFVLGGEAAEMFAAELSAPESVPPRSELRLRQSRALTAGDYILSLGIFAPAGLTATLDMLVSVPRLAPAGASGYAAAGFAGGAQLTVDLSSLAGYDGLTVSLVAPVLALTPFEISRGESALTLSLPAGFALPRAGVLADLTVAELAGGAAAEFPFRAEVSAVYAPPREEQQLHFADAGEQFDAETRYLDAAVDLALRRSGIQPFSPQDAGARVTILGVSGGNADQFRLEEDGNLRLWLPKNAAAGVYRATIAFEHPGFAGTVTVIVPAEVADVVVETPDVDAFVPVRGRTLYALGGYSGPLFTLTSDIDRAVFSGVTLAASAAGTGASADGLFGVWQPEPGRVDVTLLVSLGGFNPSDVWAELRATVSHPGFPRLAEAVTVTIRALPFVPGDPGFVEVLTDVTLSDWEFSGFADALSPGAAAWDADGLVVNDAESGGAVNLFELATESSGGRRAGGLYFRAGVTRASLAAVLGKRPRLAELKARYTAQGGDFLGAAVLEANIRISRAFHPDDFVARRNLTLKLAPRGDEMVAVRDYLWPVTSIFLPGVRWGMSSVTVVSPAAWAEFPRLRPNNVGGAPGFYIRALAARAPRAGEVATDVFVFRGDYPPEYYSEGGLVTVSVALLALAEVPRDEIALAATTRLSLLLDESGNTVLYSGWSAFSDLYADLSFKLDSRNLVNAPGLPIAILSDGKVVLTGERESDARLSDVFDVGSSFFAVVYAESPDFVGRLRMTTEILFPSRLGDVSPRLPDGVPTEGDVAGTGEEGRENCRRFGGQAVVHSSFDTSFYKEWLSADDYAALAARHEVCEGLDRSRNFCGFVSDNLVTSEKCSDYLVKVRDCNLKNRPADDLTRAGDSACGNCVLPGFRARGRRCDLLVFYGHEFVATSPGGVTVVASDSHSLVGDARVEYLGNRRGLRVMEVSSNAGGDLAGAAFAVGGFADIRAFCEGGGERGGPRWRLPRLTEAAGLVHSDGAGAAELDAAAETVRIPGVIFPLEADFKHFKSEVDFNPALSSLESDVNVISDLVALTDSGGSQAFRLAQARAEGGGLLVAGGTDSLRLVCVQDSSKYAPLANPSGLLVNGRDADEAGVVTLTFSFSPDLRAGAGGLLTLEAWRYDDSGGTIIAADDEISHAGFASGGVATEGLLAEVERTGGRVILEARLPPDLAETEIRAHSQTGRTITVKARFEGLRVTVDYAAEPAGRIGGTLTVAGLASGREAYADSTVVFSARPAAGWHVSAWSRACETGGGVATECALTASGNLSVTVFFARVIASVARVVISEGFSYENANVADLKQANPAVYGAAAFFKDGGDAELTVSADGVIGTDGGIVQGGLYRITVGATGAGIKGRARFDFALDLIALSKTPGTVGIPENRRERTRLVVAGYADRIGEYAASAAGATLRAPSSAPPGFDFRAGADYVSPKVLTITLTALLQPGAVTVGRFSVTILAAGYEATEISLALTVSALTAPQPQIGIKTAPFSGAVFDFSDSSYAGGVYGSVIFQELTGVYASVIFEELTGEGASAELDVLAGGLVTTAAPLPAGVYGITVLAESDPAYKGTATLALWLTVGWALEYGAGVGDGDLTARDESGAVLNSGAPLAPGALVTFTAQPADNWYVASWSGSCGEGGTFVGEIGSADSPGESRICAADARENLRVSVVFAQVEVSGDSGTPDGSRDVPPATPAADPKLSVRGREIFSSFAGGFVESAIMALERRLRAIFPKNSQRRFPPPFAVHPPAIAPFPNKAPKPSRASGIPAKRNKCHASA